MDGEIKRLSWMRHIHSWGRDRGAGIAGGLEKKGRRKGDARLVLQANRPQPICQPRDAIRWRGIQSGEADLGEPLELKPAVASFLWGSPGNIGRWGQEDATVACCLKTLLSGSRGRPKGATPLTGGWNYQQSQEKMIPGSLPGRSEHPSSYHVGYRNWMQKWPHFGLLLLCHVFVGRNFMPLADLIFASRDIREVPREKVVVYARASSTGHSRMICLLGVNLAY